uniref:mitotic-spindle organizing protein 2B-like isoform X2 n=1 Tax=Myxine glutinosa TaxID=7769 RepID=UPI00358E03BA
MTNQQPSVGCHAVDVTVSGLVRRSMKHQRKPLSGDERELHDLACLTGISLDPDVFRVILDLLKLNIAPQALMQVLRAICDSSTHQGRNKGQSTSASTSTGIKEKDGQQGSRPACASRQGRTGQTVSRTGVPF